MGDSHVIGVSLHLAFLLEEMAVMTILIIKIIHGMATEEMEAGYSPDASNWPMVVVLAVTNAMIARPAVQLEVKAVQIIPSTPVIQITATEVLVVTYGLGNLLRGNFLPVVLMEGMAAHIIAIIAGVIMVTEGKPAW
jgi:hypothetical protein